MDRTVRQHVLELQRLANVLTCELLHVRDTREQQRIEGKIRAIDAALSHFHAALEIESLIKENDAQKAAA